MTESLIQLPQTQTRRGAAASLTLVRRVNLDPKVPCGLAWEGRVYRPGRQISASELFEGSEDRDRIALERTEAEDTTHKGPRRRWTLLLVLWRFDRKASEWSELARLPSPCSYTAMELRQLAARSLRQDVWRELETLDESAERIHSFLARELVQLGERKAPILELVIHQLAGRLVEEKGELEWPLKRRVSKEPPRTSSSISA